MISKRLFYYPRAGERIETMAQKKIGVLIKVTLNPTEPINVWVDNPTENVYDILSIEGVTNCRIGVSGPLYIMVDPRYDVQEVADEIKTLLTASVPEVFKAEG
jgi:hypothetical protein